MTDTETSAPIWRYDPTEKTFPCGCCSPTHAMEDGLWTCQRRTSTMGFQSWRIIDEDIDLTLPHDIMVCNGRCGDPWHAQLYEIEQCEMKGQTWADLLQTWDDTRMSEMTFEELAALEAERKAAEEKAERLAPLIKLRKTMMDDAEEKRLTSNYTTNKNKKLPKPCKWLYSCEERNGKNEATTMAVSSECWSHEFTDPLTYEFMNPTTKELLPLADSYNIKRLIAEDKVYARPNKCGEYVLVHRVRCCWNQHPFESGWKDEWWTDRTYTEVGMNGGNWIQQGQQRDNTTHNNNNNRKGGGGGWGKKGGRFEKR
jgi:hypothetical protein